LLLIFNIINYQNIEAPRLAALTSDNDDEGWLLQKLALAWLLKTLADSVN
jgi:hypothetical protein